MVRHFYFCETVAAVSRKWHLREVSHDEEKKCGGGVNKPTLCGLTAAWDIEVSVPRGYDERERLEKITCPKCLEKMRQLLIMR